MAQSLKKIEEYQEVIVSILKEEVREFPLQPELKDYVLVDKENRHYQLLRLGWVEDDRILQVLIHMNIHEDGKIWIQENLTELAVDEELLKKGVPAKDIVLGLQPPAYRQFTAYASS